MTRTTFILLACCVTLWAGVSQINHYVAPFHVSAFVGGLLVTFSALRVGLREGLWCTALIGLLIDASSAVYFGFHTLIFLMVHAAIYSFRSRFPREETATGIVAALLANGILFLAITLALIHRAPEPLSALSRLFFDFLASAALIVAVGPWFFALQERALEYCGVSLRREQRGLL